MTTLGISKWLAAAALLVVAGPLSASAETDTPAPAGSSVAAPATPVESGVPPDVPEIYRKEMVLQTIHVRAIRLEGNTVLDGEIVDRVLAKYLGRDVSYEELQTLRYQLTQAYVERGYVNSGVLLPDQEVTDGSILLRAYEGDVDAIEVRGNKHLRTSYLTKRLQAGLPPVLNVTDLEKSLRLMQQRPLVAQVNAELIPGNKPGESILDLRVQEKRPITVSAGYDNHRPPSVGEHEYAVSLSHQSLTGNGDRLNANYTASNGLHDWYAGYSLPLTAKDLTIDTYFSQDNSDIVEAPFNQLDIVSKTKTWGVKFSRPLLRNLHHSFVVGLGFENKNSESFLFGAPFSFSPGEQVGKSEVSALRLSADWTWRGDRNAIALKGILSQGVTWLGATNRNDLPADSDFPSNWPDSNFLTFLLQAQYARDLGWRGTQLLTRLTGQWANDPLLPVEKLAIGGYSTVRGYRENQLVRDEGLIGSVELRAPLFIDDAGRSRIGLSLAPFVDYGIGIDKSIDFGNFQHPKSEDVSSVGAGLLWNYWQPLYAEIYYGKRLTSVQNTGNSLQEDGIHVAVTFQWSM